MIGAHLREIVIDCRAPARLARFWAALLKGYAVRAYDEAEIARLAEMGRTPEADPVVMVDGPGPILCLQERDPLPEAPGRLHLDLTVADRAKAEAEAIALGGALVRRAADYTVMADPEGNRFCLVVRPPQLNRSSA